MALTPMDANQLSDTIATGEIVLAYFWADWQEGCAETLPLMEQLGQMYEGKATIASVNADEAGFYAIEMNAYPLPTTILFQDGQEVDRVPGVQALEIYDHVLKTYVEPEDPNPFELIDSMGYRL